MIVESSNADLRAVAHLFCPKCALQSCATLLPDGSQVRWRDLMQSGKDVQDHGWFVESFWPEPPSPELPEHLPPDVARAYLQAERNFTIFDNEEAAATMYGKALDLGLKRIDPSLKGTLGANIKKLARDGKLTPDIAEWSDSIRDIRNDAVHEADSVDRQELEALRNFSEMVLRYLFSLPGAVKKRRGEKLPWETV